MNELNVKILVNDESIEIDSSQFLSSIIETIPDEDERFLKLYEEAAESPSKEVRCSVASKEYLNTETLELLLLDEDPDVLAELLNTEAGQTVIEYEDLARIIDHIGNTDLLITVAENLINFRNCDPNWIAEKLIANEDPSVRLALANNLATPNHIIKRLLIDRDRTVRKEAKDTLEEMENENDDDNIPY